MNTRLVGSRRNERRTNLPSQSTPGICLLRLIAYHNSKIKTSKQKGLVGSTEVPVVPVGPFPLPLPSSFSLSLHICWSCLSGEVVQTFMPERPVPPVVRPCPGRCCCSDPFVVCTEYESSKKHHSQSPEFETCSTLPLLLEAAVRVPDKQGTFFSLLVYRNEGPK